MNASQKGRPSGWSNGFPLAPMLDAEYGESCALEEYAFLFGFAALVRPAKVLEIGTSCGLGAISIALGAMVTGHTCMVTTIDRQDKDIQKNMRLFPDVIGSILPIVGESVEVLKRMQAANEKYDLCFVDGGHDYESVSMDWNFARTLADRWILHDSVTQPGVRKLLERIREDKNYQVFDLIYPPGYQLDEPTGEWYRTLAAPGFSLIQPKP